MAISGHYCDILETIFSQKGQIHATRIRCESKLTQLRGWDLNFYSMRLRFVFKRLGIPVRDFQAFLRTQIASPFNRTFGVRRLVKRV